MALAEESCSGMFQPASMATRVKDALALTVSCVRHRGPVATWGACRRGLQEWQFDLRFGVDTCWRSGSYNNTTPIKAWGIISQALAIRHEDFIFVDLGSGKGRTLLLASNFPFKQIVGVERAAQVHDIAMDNIARYRSKSQKCRNIISLCMDATEYDFPSEPVVIYLFNPFGWEVLSHVLANLKASLARHLRQVRVIYHHPVLQDRLEGMDFLELVTSGDRFRIYRQQSATAFDIAQAGPRAPERSKWNSTS
jgi:hypothetical protein